MCFVRKKENTDKHGRLAFTFRGSTTIKVDEREYHPTGGSWSTVEHASLPYSLNLGMLMWILGKLNNTFLCFLKFYMCYFHNIMSDGVPKMVWKNSVVKNDNKETGHVGKKCKNFKHSCKSQIFKFDCSPECDS